MSVATLLILQFVMPLGLLAWFYLWPCRNKWGLLLQFAGSLLWMVAIALMGLWTLLPWWIPHACALLMIVKAIARSRTWHTLSNLPIDGAGWSAAVGFLLLALVLVLPIGNAIAGRKPPATIVVDLQLPFASGKFLVVNGGNHVNINAHNTTLDASVSRYQEWRGQSYGVDFVELYFPGLSAKGIRPTEPDRYFIYGTEVLAPCTGMVNRTRDGVPDNAVPEINRTEMAGNYVVLRCGDLDVVLAHLRAGSVEVRPGMHVQAGAIVGVVGNSGNSDEPHLHVHAQTPGTEQAPFGGEPVVIRFNGKFLVRGDRITGL